MGNFRWYLMGKKRATPLFTFGWNKNRNRSGDGDGNVQTESPLSSYLAAGGEHGAT